MSGLIWIQTVRHSYGIPDFFSKKVDFEEDSADNKKHAKLASRQSLATSNPDSSPGAYITSIASKLKAHNVALVLYDVLVTVQAAPHECVNRSCQPKT